MGTNTVGKQIIKGSCKIKSRKIAVVKDNEASTIVVKNSLVVGDNIAKNVVGYMDPEGHATSHVSLEIVPGANKKKETSFKFNGVNIGNEGTFKFTPYQLKFLEISISSKDSAPSKTVDDLVKVKTVDAYGKVSSTPTLLSIGN